jgi:dTDP-4-amino-4,6-dideoxygalactose transaminase
MTKKKFDKIQRKYLFQGEFNNLRHKMLGKPETDLFFDNMLSFPFSLTISDKDIDYLIQSIKKALIELRD